MEYRFRLAGYLLELDSVLGLLKTCSQIFGSREDELEGDEQKVRAPSDTNAPLLVFCRVRMAAFYHISDNAMR